MDNDGYMPLIIRGIGILLVFIGVAGIFSGIYALTLIKDAAGGDLSTRDASKSVLEASLQLSKDKNILLDSLERAKGDLVSASSGLGQTSNDISNTASSLDGSAGDIGAAAASVLASANSDREAADKLIASADAMEPLWGPTNVAINLKAAAQKIKESADNMEAASVSLGKASENVKDASLRLGDASGSLDRVSGDLNSSAEDLGKVSSSVDTMIQRIISNLNELVNGLQWLDTIDKKAIFNYVAIYFILLHVLMAGTGVAIIFLSANVYGW